ncbi:hypothetical protein [Snuella sedimenti]|uniref:YcxB-like protein domain-containing protein n=1 Tax=Snuella sedimenti TaxID=2798802 RepID=A0A8J7IT73_9FLAO|nr:hypothetical protein [Snuella sedimenti]MBJ6367520.1 hypothetical protein [Snuella sedimenti]
MKFEIPFDENIYREQMILNFNIAWNENLKKNKRNLYWSIPIIIIGGLIVYGQDYIGFIFIAIGTHFAINGFKYYSFYKKTKKKYFDLIESEIQGQKIANENSLWEFNKDYFRYKYYKYDAKIKWEAFKSYRVIDKNLFLDLEVGNNSSYIIGEKEIGNTELKKVIDFANEKIR